MIPKIITITEDSKVDEIISTFATRQNISLSNRIVVQPEKDELFVDQIHLMQKDIQVAFSEIVLVALLGVDNSSNEVQNSLLKCLEEESGRIQFLLLVKNTARLLPTILSRCSYSESLPYIGKLIQEKGDETPFTFQKNSETTKEGAIERIDIYLKSSFIRDHKTLRYILSIRKLIIDNNMNPILALDAILIFLNKTSTMKVTHEKK